MARKTLPQLFGRSLLPPPNPLPHSPRNRFSTPRSINEVSVRRRGWWVVGGCGGFGRRGMRRNFHSRILRGLNGKSRRKKMAFADERGGARGGCGKTCAPKDGFSPTIRAKIYWKTFDAAFAFRLLIRFVLFFLRVARRWWLFFFTIDKFYVSTHFF